MIVVKTTDKLQVKLGGAITTSQSDCYASWNQIGASTFDPDRNDPQTNGGTAVDLVGNAGASTVRIVKEVSVFNKDTVNSTVTVQFYDGTNTRTIYQTVLAPSERLDYLDGQGWTVITTAGAPKSNPVQSNNPTSSSLTTVVLSADVTNNNATLNTLQDVTGLSFSGNSGECYYFRAIIAYTAAVTTTGSRWTMNGPSFTKVEYLSRYTVGATNSTINYNSAWQTPSGANTTSLTDGNICEIEGFVTLSANGTVIVQFASEIANSAIVALKGSILQYQRVF